MAKHEDGTMFHGCEMTFGEAVRLQEILMACQQRLRVFVTTLTNDENRPLEGVARCIGDKDGNLLFGENIFEGYLRVSGTSEYFIPMREITAVYIQ